MEENWKKLWKNIYNSRIGENCNWNISKSISDIKRKRVISLSPKNEREMKKWFWNKDDGETYGGVFCS